MTMREDYAWAAGLVDGEGSFYANPVAAWAPRLSIGQKDREVLDRFQTLFPFAKLNVYEKHTKTPNGDHHYGAFFDLKVNGFEKTQAVFAAIWPWLSTAKREQAKAAFRIHHEWPRTRALASPKG